MGAEFFEQARLYLPKYLTPSQTSELFEELNSFPDIKNFYLPPGSVDEALMQGDGWYGLVVINFFTTERKQVSGLVISNSCDISPDNRRTLPPSIVFAPLIRLDRYTALLESSGRSEEQIESITDAIRRQQVTSMFFVPAGAYGPDKEYVVLLDDIHSHPLNHFLEAERELRFRLSQSAFYVLLMKLSIHFSRFQENVQRFSTTGEPSILESRVERRDANGLR